MDLIRISFDKDRFHLQNQMVDWCEENFGQGKWNQPIGKNKWCVESMFGHTHFYFRESKDAMLFGLKWR